MSEPAHETETVVGAVDGVTQKAADKWQVAVKPAGSQYAKKLWTKDQAMQTRFAGMIGQQVSVVCNVSHWTNNEGKPIRSLWIAALGDSTPEASPQAATGRLASADPRQDSIERQTALKAAVEFYALDGERSVPAVIAAATDFAAFLRGDTPPAFTESAPTDEDIPF